MQVSDQHNAPVAVSSKKTPGTYWIEGRSGPKAVLDVLEKGKNLLPLPGFKTRAVQPIA